MTMRDEKNAAVLLRIQSLLRDLGRERSQLLPALWRVFDEYRYLGPEMIEAVSRTMNIPYAEVYGVASFYALFDNAEGHRPIYVCTDVMCALAGSEELLKASEDFQRGTTVSVKGAPCLGHCDAAPALFDGRATIRRATKEALAAAIRGEDHA